MSAPRVLQLFSNHKFTGPADPALVLSRALLDIGVDIAWSAGTPPDGGEGLLELARARGIPVATGLRMRKHGRPIPWIHDVIRLRRWLRHDRYDIVHTHLRNDHHIATMASRGLGVPVVRSLYDLEPRRDRRATASISRSAALLAPTEGAGERLRTAFPAIADRVSVVPPALDLSRFDHLRDPGRRATWNADDSSFVVGVVARMQTHRRFPELIEGFARAARTDAGLRLVVLGRGTHQRTVAHEPAAASGVGDRIHFPGYAEPAEYPTILPSFDALIFLVPGSDGTCRAAREAQAAGVPLIAPRRGLLPELFAPGESGILLESDEPDDIAGAIRELRANSSRRDRLAAGAKAFAARRFDASEAARSVLEIYRGLKEDPR